MALEIGKKLKAGAEYVWTGTKESVKSAGKGIVGGIADSTVLNVYHTLGDILKGPGTEIVQGVAQPIGRAGLAIKELVTLHPGKAVAQLALGAEKLAEHAVNLVPTVAEAAANTIKRATRGIARAIAGVVGENIMGDRYKELMQEVTIKTGVEGLLTGRPEAKPLFA